MYVIIDTHEGGDSPKVIFSTYRRDTAEEIVLSIYEESMYDYFNIYIQKYPTFSNGYLIDFAKSSARNDMRFINIEKVPITVEDYWFCKT